jgi:hypothetical protein
MDILTLRVGSIHQSPNCNFEAGYQIMFEILTYKFTPNPILNKKLEFLFFEPP